MKKDWTDLAYSPTAEEWVEAIEDLKDKIEQNSRRFYELGYQCMFRADLLRANGVKLSKAIPDHAMVTLSTRGAMVIVGVFKESENEDIQK